MVLNNTEHNSEREWVSNRKDDSERSVQLNVELSMFTLEEMKEKLHLWKKQNLIQWVELLKPDFKSITLTYYADNTATIVPGYSMKLWLIVFL